MGVENSFINNGSKDTYVKKGVTISKLKANTKYSVRFVPYAKIDGKNVQGKASKTFTMSTGLKSTPAIKSVKISNVKANKAKRTKIWIPGHFSGGMWHPGYYAVSPASTSFTVKVVLKKRIKGTSGLLINEKYVSGKGTAFKTKVKLKGYYKGKNYRVKVASYKNKNYGGLSKTKTKTVKIK